MAAIGALMTGTAAYVTAAVVLFVLILLLAPFAFGSLRVRRKEERLPHPVFIR